MSDQSSSPGTTSAITVWITSLIVVIFVGFYIYSFLFDGVSWNIFIIVLCFIMYCVIYLTNMLYQYTLCPNDPFDWNKIAIGAIPSIGIVGIGSLLVIYVSTTRIPIASLLKPYILQIPSVMRQRPRNQRNACCDDKMDLTKLEYLWPPLKRMSYLYYLFFMVALSVIVGQSNSTISCLPRK